jgi:hypothetical protein
VKLGTNSTPFAAQAAAACPAPAQRSGGLAGVLPLQQVEVVSGPLVAGVQFQHGA